MNPPKMPIHIGDYQRDTGHLRAAEHGAYLLLLFHQWSTGELPADDDHLSAIARMTKSEWKKAKPILSKFFQEGWVHARVVKDLAESKESYEKLAAAGSKGGKARAENKRRLSDATSEASSDATSSLNLPLTFNLSKKEDSPADAGSSSKAYAFESGVIRLNERDFELFAKSFGNLDLAAELLSLSQWAETQGKNWFHAVKGALAKRNRDVKANKKKAEQEPFKWNGIEGVI